MGNLKKKLSKDMCGIKKGTIVSVRPENIAKLEKEGYISKEEKKASNRKTK